MITVRRVMPLILACFLVVSRVVLAKSTAEEVGLGPQSTQAVGNKRVLMVVVRFPDAAPTTPIEVVKKKVIEGLGSYVDEQSYGLASITADFRGYVMLPDALADYRVSPYNFRVDKTRIRKLIGDTMTAIEKDTDFSAYDHFMIVPAVHTMPGQGYGMICYCANPGMLSGVTKGYVPRYVTMKSAGGKEFSGGQRMRISACSHMIIFMFWQGFMTGGDSCPVSIIISCSPMLQQVSPHLNIMLPIWDFGTLCRSIL